jgi:hypothetical protein
MVTANMWKVETNTYSIQFNNVKRKERKVILELLEDWEEKAIGFHPDGSELYIFSKKVSDNENIYSALKKLPYPLTEERKNGSLKTIKTEFNRTKTSKNLTSSKKRARIKGQRSCSRCGQIGHNSRTCKA